MAYGLPEPLVAAARERRLSFADIGFAIALYIHADSRGLVSASVSEIVERTGAARRGVVDTLRRLHAAGVVVYRPTDTRYLKSSVEFIGAIPATMPHGDSCHDASSEQEHWDAGFESSDNKDISLESPKKVKPKVKVKRLYATDSDEYRIASALLDSIRVLDPKHKANLQMWADHVRLLHERDGREYDEIMAVVKWLRTDEFWRGVILSTAKLREKFPQLVVKAKPHLRYVRQRQVQAETEECPVCLGMGVVEHGNDAATLCTNPGCKGGRVPKEAKAR